MPIYALFLLLISGVTFAAPSDSGAIVLGRVSGFKFCKHLDGSVFDLNSLIDYKHVQPHISSDCSDQLRAAANREQPYTLSETMPIFPEALDVLARALNNKVASQNLRLLPLIEHSKDTEMPHPDPESALRFACFSVAEGIYGFAPFASELRMQRILQFVDNQKYFDNQLSFAPFDIKHAQLELNLRDQVAGFIRPTHSKFFRSSHAAANGKLAFILMVHKNIENVKEIVKDVSESQSTVLIHVDGNNPELKQELQEWLQSEYEVGHYNPDLVKVMAKSFKGAWGHSSLVFMQLEAMFELLSMNDSWEYVINMSGYDILLVDHETIYNQLRPYKDANWLTMGYVPPPEICKIPQSSTLLAANCDYAGILNLAYERESPILEVHNDQWMILHRSTAQRIQQSPSAATYLAYHEFETVPDELFMSNLLGYSPFYNEAAGNAYRFAVVDHSLRHLRIENHHATFYYKQDWRDFVHSVKLGRVISRKVDYHGQAKFVELIRERRDKSWHNEMPTKCGNCHQKINDVREVYQIKSNGKFEDDKFLHSYCMAGESGDVCEPNFGKKECLACLQEINAPASLRRLKCDHIFHRGCLSARKDPSDCPICEASE